jgi:hypothetical protein
VVASTRLDVGAEGISIFMVETEDLKGFSRRPNSRQLDSAANAISRVSDRLDCVAGASQAIAEFQNTNAACAPIRVCSAFTVARMEELVSRAL